jgi:hypothetical protein
MMLPRPWPVAFFDGGLGVHKSSRIAMGFISLLDQGDDNFGGEKPHERLCSKRAMAIIGVARLLKALAA